MKVKARDLSAALVLLLVALTVGSGTPAASADTCPATKVVIYTTDTQFLAGRLGLNPSDCADYYISISPIVTPGPTFGEPRDGAALTAVHNQGPKFHALAELRPWQWSDYAAANGWYATGVKLHDDMIDAGYNPAAGDTWAVNEVGSPTAAPSTFPTDVFNGVDGARQNFRDFVHGLHDGSGRPGYEATMQGVVFAADPPQLAPNVADYAQKLASWYADAPFWQDMHSYVGVWAQETYADVRAWGVAGSPLADRTAYLNDYFLHGLRVAEDGNDATKAARTFLNGAYVPLASAAHRYPPPNPPEGPGYGSTDIPVAGMQRFISAETYAERSALGTRLGFVVDPKNTADKPTNKSLIDDRVAAAIHDSQSSPIGACTATNESCDFDVADAASTGSWKALANTQDGTGVAVQLATGVSVTFDGVSARGSTWFSSSPTDETPDGWAAVGPTYDIATTAVTSGQVEVCLGAGTGHVFRRTGDVWSDITSSPGCGTADTTDLPGTFALFVDPTPPVVVPHVSGPLGKDDWYVGDVAVSWEVSDPQTPVSNETGCDSLTVTDDTAGTTYSCAATSEGGTTTEQATVKRDATPPDVTCTPTPSTLWPPDGELIAISVAVDVSDATSGPDGFLLSAAPAADAAGFVTGTPDVSGLLRAKRPGNGDARTYTLVYTASDAAGNTTQCSANVVVPHDQGN